MTVIWANRFTGQSTNATKHCCVLNFIPNSIFATILDCVILNKNGDPGWAEDLSGKTARQGELSA